MPKMFIHFTILTVLISTGSFAQADPWWKQQKINFMWGLWGIANPDTSKADWARPVPPRVFQNAAQAGATVFADTWQYSTDHARKAKAFGLKYFPTSHLHHMEWLPGPGRAWITRTGEMGFRKGQDNPDYPLKCPLDSSVWERWLASDAMREGIRTGLVDGIHTDWESPQTGVTFCYCDVCFARFLNRWQIEAELPDRRERYAWLDQHGHLDAYHDKQVFSSQRIEMFTRIRRKLQAIKPDLMFSSYALGVTDFTQAMHTPQVPFVLLDSRHYYNDDRQPWWESYQTRLKQEGYLYIPGGWTNALFGSQPSQVSAARWLYEAMLNTDGVWVWFEHELTDEMFGAYAAADRDLKVVEAVVGDFLFHGRPDPHFVTATEWTGNPHLQRAVQRTYHRDDKHLVHVNNVDTEWPLRVSLSFPRLAGDGAWTVTDPMGGVHYTPDGDTPLWTSAQLRAGIAVAMDTRSDLFLLLCPAEADLNGPRLMHSRDFDTMPSHAESSTRAAGGQPREHLPQHGWRFRMDEQDAGVRQRWFAPESSLAGWNSIPIEDFWSDHGGEGPGWYRRDVVIPDLPEGKRIYLHFGAVDEELMLWIDGQPAGEFDLGPDGWDTSFAIDVTGRLKAGKRHLAMRIYNSKYAGGVWKPVGILAADKPEGNAAKATIHGEQLKLLLVSATRIAIPFDAGAPDRLVFTGTTQMLPEGHSGVRSIVNNAIKTTSSGGGGQTLRHLRGYLWSPSYAPVGNRIAFVHDAGGRGQIYLMNEDGSNAVDLSQNVFCDRAPAWSPDGEKMAFVSNRTGDWDIHVMNADGSNQRRVAGHLGMDRAPAWSPDGTRIAWLSDVSGTPDIWVCNTDGSNSRPLIHPDNPLTIERGNIGEDQIFKFVDNESYFPENTFYFLDLAWSPAGDRIAAIVLGGNGGQSVLVIHSDGTALRRLIGYIGGVADVCWSPDGRWLALSHRTAPQETERSGILVVKSDGTDENPNGTWLIDVKPQGPRVGGVGRLGNNTWYAHGSAQPRRVVKTFTSLAWSPNGKLAFSSDMDPSGAFYVYTVHPDGGEPRRIDATQSVWPNQISWRP